MFTLQVAKDCGKDSIPLNDMTFNFQASETEGQSLFYFLLIRLKSIILEIGRSKTLSVAAELKSYPLFLLETIKLSPNLTSVVILY